MTLVKIFDEMVKNEKILQDQNQDLHMLIKVTNMILESSRRKNNKLDGRIKEAEKKIFDLEQIVRTLKIQLEDEREINADLDIENIKLKKKIQGLQSSLESLNNNLYGDEEMDNLLMSSSDSTLDFESTLLEGNLHANDIKLLSEATMSSSPLGADATFIFTSTPAIVDESISNQATRFPYNSDTFTKKVFSKNATSTTYKKKSKRRSKSVDFQIGKKIVIAPSACEACLSRPRNAADDSLPLPWCPHSQTPVSINVTAARSSGRNYGSSSRIPLKPILKKRTQIKTVPRENL